VISVGVDIGSITTKAAVLRGDEILGTLVIMTGYNVQNAGEQAFGQALAALDLKRDQVDKVIATGYGRNSVRFADEVVTEITCHATGAHFLSPSTRSIIDVGGQDTKAIVVDEGGKVKDFAMNDKCAAGTGRFLEVMARALEVDLDAFGKMSLRADEAATISSLSEVISLISKGERRENIIAGIHQSIAARVVSMGRRIRIREPIMMTGGVAKNIGVVRALEREFEAQIAVSDEAQVTGAIGAALMAAARAHAPPGS
jgi:predicted CoA-substrate-specific enzyme activase